LLAARLTAAGAERRGAVLLEAETFAETGGWVVDAQHLESPHTVARYARLLEK